MNRSRGISGFIATLILVAISLSLSYVVYQAVSSFSAPKAEVFSNQSLALGGAPDVVEFQVNVSAPANPQALEADNVNSHEGVLYFGASGYGTTPGLCLSTATTFFSVYATNAGTIQTVTDGTVTIDGQSTASLVVAQGWHEIMFTDASSCQVRGPDGSNISYPGPLVSTVPLIGSFPSTSFRLFLPTDGGSHSLLLVFDGGYDRLA